MIENEKQKKYRFQMNVQKSENERMEFFFDDIFTIFRLIWKYRNFQWSLEKHF